MKSKIWLSSLTLAFSTMTIVSLEQLSIFSSANAHATNEPNQQMHHGEMHHQKLEVLPNQPAPAVSLIVYPDAKRGWNLQVKVSNFKFAPERVNTKSNTLEGHAHLYVDGKKLTRLYGSWYYLESLSPGKHKISVTLNANGHEDLTYKGKAIEAYTTIEVPPTK